MYLLLIYKIYFQKVYLNNNLMALEYFLLIKYLSILIINDIKSLLIIYFLIYHKSFIKVINISKLNFILLTLQKYIIFHCINFIKYLMRNLKMNLINY